MLTIDKLRQYGAKVDVGLARCMDSEAMYDRLIGMALEDVAFSRLEERLAAGDLDAAFSAAHSLKGSMGNLALEPIYAPVSELTELLRNKTPGDYAGLLERIKAQRAALLALLEE